MNIISIKICDLFHIKMYIQITEGSISVDELSVKTNIPFILLNLSKKKIDIYFKGPKFGQSPEEWRASH